MVKLKITSKGQVTLKKELLDRLGVTYGDEIDVDVVGKGRGSIHVVEKKLPIESIFGMLPNRAGRSHSIEEINEAIAAGWAGEVDLDDDD